MRKHHGWIALDIDGTITDSTHFAPKEVIDCLHSLADLGWEIIFITGRTLSFASQVIDAFHFPFYIAVQNGADILLMPQKERVAQYYLNAHVIPVLEKAYDSKKEDFLIYSGYERGDFCYYRPERFSDKMREHVHKIMSLSPEPWKELKNFHFEKSISFPLAKCLGTKKAMQDVNARLEQCPAVSATLIRDPLTQDEVYLNLVTAAQATKGNALRTLKQLTGDGGPVIAAGDDLNDLSMLAVADIKIVMNTAPQEMHPLATILAAHDGKQHGIISALHQAVEMCS